MMERNTGHTIVIDFDQTSVLPASFALHSAYSNRLDFDIGDMVAIPGANPQNLPALREAQGLMVFSSHLFMTVGRAVAGGDQKSQKRYRRELARN